MQHASEHITDYQRLYTVGDNSLVLMYNKALRIWRIYDFDKTEVIDKAKTLAAAESKAYQILTTTHATGGNAWQH